MPPPHRTVFVTEQPLLIASVRNLVLSAGCQTDLQVVGPEETQRAITAAEPCLAILDAESLPSDEVLGRLHTDAPHSRLVLWVTHATPAIIQIGLQEGFHGVLSSRLPLAEAIDCVTRIWNGEHILRFQFESATEAPAEMPVLTPRERRLLTMIARDWSNADIAAAQHSSVSAVKAQLHRIFQRAGVVNRRQLALWMRNENPATLASTSSDFDTQWMFSDLQPGIQGAGR